MSMTMSFCKEKTCHACQRGGDVVIATFWCQDCAEALCDICNGFHKRIKSTTSHSVSKLTPVKSRVVSKQSKNNCSKLSEHQRTTTPSEITPAISEKQASSMCDKHSGHYLKHFCPSHQKLCCDVCISQFHDECQNICTVDGIIDSESSLTESMKLLTVLREMDVNSEEMVNVKSRHINHLDIRYQQILDNMSTLLDELKQKLDNLYSETLKNVKQFHNQETTENIRKSKVLEKFQHTVKWYKSLMKYNRESATKTELLIIMHKMQSDLKTEVAEILLEFAQDYVKDFDLNMNDALDKFGKVLQEIQVTNVQTKTRNTNDLDKIQDSVKTFSDRKVQYHSQPPEVEPENSITSGNIHCSKVHARKISEIRINGSRFYRGIFLNDNQILIPDYNFEKLKIYDVTGNFKFDYPLLRKPWDVACNTSGRIFVSCPNSMCFKKFTLSGYKFMDRQTIYTHDSGVQGFDDVLGDYILYSEKYSVNILQPNGQLLRTISVSSQIPFITASLMEPKFYFTDGDCIICQNIEGDELERYTGLDLSSIVALSGDAKGGVYVSSFCDEILSILKISNSKQVHLVAKVNIGDDTPPRGITFDTQGRRFMVVSHLESPGNIKRAIRSMELLPFPAQMMEAGLAEIYQMQEDSIETVI